MIAIPTSTPPAFCRALFGISGQEGEGLTVPIGMEITVLTLSIAGDGFLNFSNLLIIDSDGRTLDPGSIAEVSCSPPHASMGKWTWEQDRGATKGYHSDHKHNPFFTIRFSAPLTIASISVRNRLGRWGVRLLPLEITAKKQEEIVFSWQNISAVRVAATANGIDSCIRQLRARYDSTSFDDLLVAAGHFFRISFKEMVDASPEAFEAFCILKDRALRVALELGKNNVFKGWQILEPIIDKYPDLKSRATNIELLAAYFALRLRDAAIGREFADLLASWNGFFTNAEELAELERLVAVQFVKLGGVGHPVITRHGWSVSVLSRFRQETLAAITKLIDGLSIDTARAFLVYGTLLGAVRDNDFIPYDDDADIAIEMDWVDEVELAAKMEAICARAAALGFKAKYSPEFKVVQVASPDAPEVGIDIFSCTRGTGLFEGLYRMQHRGMEWRYISQEILFPLTTVELIGAKLAAPRLPDTFLEWRYGNTWNVPLKFFEMDWIFSR
jgi:LicD family